MNFTSKEIGVILVVFVGVQLVVAIVASYGLNGKYFRGERDIGMAMRKFSQEKPTAALITKTCYTLMIVELVIALVI